MTSSVLACEVVKVTHYSYPRLSIFILMYDYKQVAFGGVVGDLCSAAFGERWKFEEGIQRVDFGWLLNCFRTTSSHLRPAKQLVADLIQKS